ncbi:acyl carrier protein [Amycolatopsis pithecellobii]|uniref:acyl carrier protein n=1 Tax=Amycolatopsis pithecellobii TaxID=664692 RepID=UPI0012B85290|nr:acyl carrier protein [Amycolatopsis pithecellobii]
MNQTKQISEADAIRSWLRQQISQHTDRSLDLLENDVPLSSYGMDSISAISLAVEIEERYGLELDTDTLWEYRTIDRLVQLLTTLTPA